MTFLVIVILLTTVMAVWTIIGIVAGLMNRESQPELTRENHERIDE